MAADAGPCRRRGAAHLAHCWAGCTNQDDGAAWKPAPPARQLWRARTESRPSFPAKIARPCRRRLAQAAESRLGGRAGVPHPSPQRTCPPQRRARSLPTIRVISHHRPSAPSPSPPPLTPPPPSPILPSPLPPASRVGRRLHLAAAPAPLSSPSFRRAIRPCSTATASFVPPRLRASTPTSRTCV